MNILEQLTRFSSFPYKNLKKKRFEKNLGKFSTFLKKIRRGHIYMSSSLAHYLYFPHPNSEVFMPRVFKSHSVFNWVPITIFWGLPPNPSDLETPTRLTNASHHTSKTGCTSAKIL
jgi:hypothetical protein